MTTNPWAWRDGHNPYRRTPFQILDLAVDLAGRGQIEAVIRKRRQRIQSTPERYPLFGQVLDEAMVNTAAAEVRAPEERLSAELRTHRPNRAAAIDLGDLAARVERVPTVEPDGQVSVDLARLAMLIPAPSPRTFPPLPEWWR